jgi:hypothetical protein
MTVSVVEAAAATVVVAVTARDTDDVMLVRRVRVVPRASSSPSSAVASDVDVAPLLRNRLWRRPNLST